MKVLLTHGYFIEEDEKERKIMRPYPPLGLLYISAYLTENGIPNDVFDTTFSSFDALKLYVLEKRPTLIGLYVNLMTKTNVLKIMSFLKNENPATKIVLGGPEVRHSAENFLRRGADVIVLGEGEQTMREVADCILNGRSVDSSIKGIAFLEKDSFIETPEREQLRDLDSLPEPSRDKIDIKRYLDSWKRVHGLNTISVSTMRGCPYTCKWCSRAVYGLSYRRRSAGKVVEELQKIIERYRPDSFWFVDDVFTISHKWLESFKENLAQANVKIRYECITRADRMNEEVIKTLKETGCYKVWIGAESGSQKVLDLMDRRVRVTQVRDMITLAKRHGIETGTFIMLGYPGETEQDIEETIEHLKAAEPDHFTITITYPIKGTELFNEVQITESWDWESQSDRLIEFKRNYVRRYYDYAVRRVVNEVNYHKQLKTRGVKAATFKLKSLAAKLGMWYYS